MSIGYIHPIYSTLQNTIKLTKPNFFTSNPIPSLPPQTRVSSILTPSLPSLSSSFPPPPPLFTFCAIYQVYGPHKYKTEMNQSAFKPHDTPAGDRLFSRLNDAAIMMFWCAIYFVKMSFLALYWTLFGLSKRFRVAWGVLTAFVVLSFLTSMVWRLALRCPTGDWAKRCEYCQRFGILKMSDI